MSKSLNKVQTILQNSKINFNILKTKQLARTAIEAAEQIGCSVDQIVKSLIFTCDDDIYLFFVSGSKHVDMSLASELVQRPLTKASADIVRQRTGFVIGGVAPIGHREQVTCYLDITLMDFDVVWAAAGTPNHVFSIKPDGLVNISNAEIANFAR